ncbi:hypothetical protein [Cellulomonas phragmiteti]|uniref:Butirosin biosynthesis protein H N-terminal domain-containing protein n=1 Tax=Cellulomonas phragmiteti TaxID=478780 RepID=A0ABQ4DR18_9CELL|nr:hypothetical protein [Cellulomonas phragmiteti]GIG41805.1 hypothetical protein Cph01nite_35670 [Cellulomonas phragmiteti]
MRKVLPVERPLAYAFQFYAFPLAILQPHPRSRDWVLSNYVQTAFDTAPGSPVPYCFYLHDHTASPWLRTQRFTREWLGRRGERIDDLVRDAVADGWYVYLTVNERYVEHRRAHVEDVDYPHDVLVHGCDDDDDTFVLLGYDDEQMFRSTSLPQESLCTAFEAMGPRPFHDTGVVLYRYDDTATYDLDPGFVADVVEEYLRGTDTSRRHQDAAPRMDRVWGAPGLVPLAASLEAYARGEQDFDILGLQVLWEHKRLMVARAERCGELGGDVTALVPELRRLERLTWTLRTMMLETVDGDRAAFGRDAVRLVEQVAAQEQQVLADLVGELRAASVGAQRKEVTV